MRTRADDYTFEIVAYSILALSVFGVIAIVYLLIRWLF